MTNNAAGGKGAWGEGAVDGGMKDVRVLIRDLNPILRGWGNYFRTGNAARKFNQMDEYVWERLRRFQFRRKGRHLRAGEPAGWTHDFFWQQGLHRLRGTVQYPGAPRMPRSDLSPVSRVPAIGMHGLPGVLPRTVYPTVSCRIYQ